MKRSPARDPEQVAPVPPEHVQTTLPFVDATEACEPPPQPKATSRFYPGTLARMTEVTRYLISAPSST
jgi:hypothetical protein